MTLLDLEPEEIAPALRRVLEDQDKDDRLQRFAARHFAKLGRAGVETLLEAFRSGGARTRAFAIGGLSQVAQKTDEIVATFVSALDDEAAKVRSEGVSGLRRVAESDGSTIPQLVKALDHKEENVRRGAASAFAAHEIGLAASDGIPSLIRLLGDDVIEVRRTAAYALGRIGPPGKDAIPALIDRLDDPNAEVRMYVAAALARVDTSGRTLDRAFPLLLEALKAPQEWAAKYEAKLALVSLQSVESAEMATRVVAALEGLLEDDDSYIRNHAEQSLEKLRRSLKPETRLTPR